MSKMPAETHSYSSDDWVKLNGPEDSMGSSGDSFDGAMAELAPHAPRKAVAILGHEAAGPKVLKVLGSEDGNKERSIANEALINMRTRQMLDRLKTILNKRPPNSVVRVQQSIREQAQYSDKASRILGDETYETMGKLGYLPYVPSHHAPSPVVEGESRNCSKQRGNLQPKAVQVLGEDPRLWGFKASQILGPAGDAEIARKQALNMEIKEMNKRVKQVLAKRPSHSRMKLPHGMSTLPSKKAAEMIGCERLDDEIRKYVPRSQDKLPTKSRLKVASLTGATANLVPNKALKVLGEDFADESAAARAMANQTVQRPQHGSAIARKFANFRNRSAFLHHQTMTPENKLAMV